MSWFQDSDKQVAFWRKEPPVIRLDDAKGGTPTVVTGGMFDHQLEWWDADSFIKALVTGYGGGKTSVGCKRAISLAIYNNPSPVSWVSPSFKVAKRTAVPTMKSLLYGKQLNTRGALQYRYNKQDFEFIIHYLSLIHI